MILLGNSCLYTKKYKEMHENNRLQILGGNYFCRDKCGGVNLLVMLYFLSWMMVHGNLFHYTMCYFVSSTYFIINSKHSRKKKIKHFK